MTVNVGLIGAGVMGLQHAHMSARRVPGARLVAISDADREQKVAGQTGVTRTFQNAAELIASPEIDAVVVASSDDTRPQLVLECIRHDKPVLCEKPLALTTEDCRRIVEAEMEKGRRLVQVGFMRRFDAGYREMHSAVLHHDLGRPLFMHCVHRIAEAPHYFTTEIISLASAVHEIDAARYVLGDELAKVLVRTAPSSRRAPGRSPFYFLFTTKSGYLIDVEISTYAQYGYDLRAELVLEDGTISLAPPAATLRRSNGSDGIRIDPDWTQTVRRGIHRSSKCVDRLA